MNAGSTADLGAGSAQPKSIWRAAIFRSQSESRISKPRLGLIIGQRYLAHALLDAAGTWRGAYRPVGLRCFPFQAPDIGDDPLSDILIDADSEYLSPTSGTAHRRRSRTARPTLTDLHRLFSAAEARHRSRSPVRWINF